VGENQAFLCSALYTWSLNLAKHQEDFLAPLPGIEEKEVPASTLRHQEAAALANQAWTRSISGVPSVSAIVDFMDLWDCLAGITLSQESRDTVSWRLTANGEYSVRSVYNMFFLGRLEVPGTKKLWSSSALIRPKRIYFPEHFCYCFSSNL
jgi:hypothetical protein